jgi:hypothetical protein
VKRIAFALLFSALPLFAQTPHEDLLSLQDNSFLLEEAYNQDPGVVQHLGVFTRSEEGEWELSFTEERPLGGLKHQISYDIPFNRDGLADISINYRYQAIGDASAQFAFAPRLSVILPTGDDSETGVSIGFPASYVIAPRVATHTNVELTWQDGTELSLGQSIVYAPSSRVHLLLEATYADDELVVSPGVRWGYDRPSGWQIVPGIAVPIGDESAVLLYLSFER